MFLEREIFICQITESHTDNGNNHIRNCRPPLEHLDKELQTQIIDQDINDSDDEVTYDLCPSSQSGAREADVTCHPKTSQESDGELEDESSDMRSESEESQMKHLAMKHKMIEHVIKHPFQCQIQAATATITEQFQAHHLPERRIEKVDDGSHQRLNMVFYVSYQSHFISTEIKPLTG